MYSLYFFFFFLFKQKTAYEMRISDWSSGVCSSDLAMPDDRLDVGQDDVETRHAVVGEGDAEIDHQPPAGIAVQVQVHADLVRPAERQEVQVVVPWIECQHVSPYYVDESCEDPPEIGRASCRERVCHYV